MKEKIELIQLHEPLFLNEIVELHRQVYNSSVFNNKLIYYDPGFFNYFRRLFGDAGHFIYIVLVNKEIAGFCHFKVIDTFLFLNTVSVNSKFFGRGVGKKLLYYSINDILNSTFPTSVKLDVFKSNCKALNWYNNLGFVLENDKNWYSIDQICSQVKHPYKILPDNNGFKSLYIENTKVGTIVAGNLLLHDTKRIMEIDSYKFNSIITNDNFFVYNHLLNENTYKLIDISMRMTVSVEILLNKLKI